MNKKHLLILAAGFLVAAMSGCATAADAASLSQTLSTFAADLARQILAAALL